MPAQCDACARKQNVDGERVDRPLCSACVSSPINGVCVSEQMMTQLVSKGGAPTPGIEIPVDYCNPKSIDLGISAVNGCFTEGERVREQTHSFHKISQFMHGCPSVHPEKGPGHGRSLFNCPTWISWLYRAQR